MLNYQPVISELKRLFGTLRGRRVFEIGCGDGILLRYLKEVEGMEVRGLDKSKVAVEYARRHNNLDGRVEAGGLGSLDKFPSSWADVILSVRTMEPFTLTASQVENYVRHSDHILKHGGLQLHFVTEDVYKSMFERLGYVDVTTEPVKGGLFNYCITARKR
jgi:cyclopropane fatty-acyl-phospholipid synthase-like methyltransferase